MALLMRTLFQDPPPIFGGSRDPPPPSRAKVQLSQHIPYRPTLNHLYLQLPPCLHLGLEETPGTSPESCPISSILDSLALTSWSPTPLMSLPCCDDMRLWCSVHGLKVEYFVSPEFASLATIPETCAVIFLLV